MINLKVNGQDQQCKTETTLPDLLLQLKMNPQLVAIEYNGEILHRQFWTQTVIEEGDSLEVVTIVGGG
jgi:sulfur carrier protein